MVAQSVKEVEGDIVDLAAELYPPVDLSTGMIPVVV